MVSPIINQLGYRVPVYVSPGIVYPKNYILYSANFNTNITNQDQKSYLQVDLPLYGTWMITGCFTIVGYNDYNNLGGTTLLTVYQFTTGFSIDSTDEDSQASINDAVISNYATQTLSDVTCNVSTNNTWIYQPEIYYQDGDGPVQPRIITTLFKGYISGTTLTVTQWDSSDSSHGLVVGSVVYYSDTSYGTVLSAIDNSTYTLSESNTLGSEASPVDMNADESVYTVYYNAYAKFNPVEDSDVNEPTAYINLQAVRIA